MTLATELETAILKLAHAELYADDKTFKRVWNARWAAYDRLVAHRAVSPAELMAKFDACIAEYRTYKNDAAAMEMLLSVRRDLAEWRDHHQTV